jgi:hypothetical protein
MSFVEEGPDFDEAAAISHSVMQGISAASTYGVAMQAMLLVFSYYLWRVEETGQVGPECTDRTLDDFDRHARGLISRGRSEAVVASGSVVRH